MKASLTGSILGNLLLVLGLSFFLGGLKHEEQEYNARSASVHATSLVLAVTGLLMPALFALGGDHSLIQREVVSGTVAAVLITLYLAALAFTLITHEHLFRTPDANEEPSWSRGRAIGYLLGIDRPRRPDVGVPRRLPRYRRSSRWASRRPSSA